MMIGRYIVGKDFTTQKWWIYDKFRDARLCYDFKTKEDAYAWVRKLEEMDKWKYKS